MEKLKNMARELSNKKIGDIMGRVETREELFKRVFAFTLTRETESVEEEEDKKIEKDYLVRAYNQITENFDGILEEIEKYTKGYQIGRVYKVDLAILVVAVYEIKNEKDIPVAVSINEALNLAKKYSTEKSAKFINGVLANFAEKKD